MASNNEKVELGPLTIKFSSLYPLTPDRRQRLGLGSPPNVKGVFETVALAFGQRIVIADAHASTVRKEGPRCYAELAKQVRLSPDPAQVPEQYRTLLMQGAVFKAEEVSRETAGFVVPRRAKVVSMSADEIARRTANDPNVRIAPDEKGSIHINFVTLLGEAKYRNLQVARTIIHEATHKFCDTRDFAYSYEDGYRTMSQAQALLNADSYAYVAVSLYKDHYFPNSRAMESATINMNG